MDLAVCGLRLRLAERPRAPAADGIDMVGAERTRCTFTEAAGRLRTDGSYAPGLLLLT